MNLGVLERWHFSFKKPLLSLPFRRVTWKGTHITFASLIKESQCHTRTTKKVGGGGKLQNFSKLPILFSSSSTLQRPKLASEVFRGRFNTPFNLTYRLALFRIMKVLSPNALIIKSKFEIDTWLQTVGSSSFLKT